MNKPSEHLLSVLPRILADYKQAVIDMPREGHYEWLHERGMDRGICRYARLSLRKSISVHVEQLIGFGYLNDNFPKPYYTYEENLAQLQVRIDRMEKLLRCTEITGVNVDICHRRAQTGEPSLFVNWRQNGEQHYVFFTLRSYAEDLKNRLLELSR